MKNWIQSLFYVPKHSKPTDENILRLLLPSLVGIIICMVCLAGSTCAWFTAGVQTTPQTIAAGSFDVAVSITDENNEPVASGGPLRAGQAYTVMLTAGGTVPSGGYCKVEGSTAPLYTVPLKQGESLRFTLIPEKDGPYTFTGVWGSYSGNADITDGCTVGQKRADSSTENTMPYLNEPSALTEKIPGSAGSADSPQSSEPAIQPDQQESSALTLDGEEASPIPSDSTEQPAENETAASE